jgi:uncharacterized protein DUF3383
MAIAFTKYVDITSSVGGGAAASTRELIGRLFTTNPLLPTGSFIEFTSATDVGTYFGTSSEEYARAVQYFSFISKNIVSPEKISYARWTDTDVAPLIYGLRITTTLAAFQAITNGSFNLTLGSTTHTIGGLDFSAATSLADVATVIQTEIRTNTGIQWTAATVTYDSTRGAFNFVGGDAVSAVISVAAAGSGTDIRTQIGWITGAIFSNGALAETITQTLTASDNASSNFGSFLFLPTLSLDEITEAAIWNESLNVKYMYTVPVTLADYSSYSIALIGYAGIGLTISETTGEYPEQLPMEIFAATNYDARDSVQNYMYQQDNLTPSVSDTTTSNALDAARINYYGRTQTAGQFLDFYQRGVLMGGTSDPTDMNVYANEIWLKDAAGTAIINLFLALNRIPATNQGRAQILTTLQSIIDAAVNNGTISVGKLLTTQQKLFISSVTGDPDAWYQVQTIGYWADVVITSFVTSDSRVEYKAIYTLVYTKDDAIRKVEGSHVLI